MKNTLIELSHAIEHMMGAYWRLAHFGHVPAGGVAGLQSLLERMW